MRALCGRCACMRMRAHACTAMRDDACRRVATDTPEPKRGYVPQPGAGGRREEVAAPKGGCAHSPTARPRGDVTPRWRPRGNGRREGERPQG